MLPWYFSAHYSSFLDEEKDMLFKRFESTWKTTKPQNRVKLMLQFTHLLGRFSSLDVSVHDVMKKLMKMGQKEMEQRKSGALNNDDITLNVLQSSSKIQFIENSTEYQITKCLHRELSQELNNIKAAITSQLEEMTGIVCTFDRKLEENKQSLSEITEHTTELCTCNRQERISPVLYFTFVVAFFALLIEEVMILSTADQLLVDKIKSLGIYLWSRLQWVKDFFPKISNWVFSSYNPKKVMWKFMLVMVPVCCVIYLLPALIRFLLGYEVIGFLLFVATIYLQYSIQSWSNMVVSISFFILYVLAKRMLAQLKHYLFYLYLFSLSFILLFLLRLYNHIVYILLN